MKRSIGLWQLIGFASTSLAGTLLHYLYDWSGNSLLAAPFSSINESTWEHMKLLFWPLFAFAILQSFFFKDLENFWCVKLKGSILGIGLIPVIFYTYNGVIGPSPDWFNITIFFIAAAAVYIYETLLFGNKTAKCFSEQTAFIIFCLLAFLFVMFTFIVPEIGIFKDPLTGRYGLAV